MRHRTPNRGVLNRYVVQPVTRVSHSSYPIPAWGIESTSPEINDIGKLKQFCGQDHVYLQRPLPRVNDPPRINPILQPLAVSCFGIVAFLVVFTHADRARLDHPERSVDADTGLSYAVPAPESTPLLSPDLLSTTAINTISPSLPANVRSLIVTPADGDQPALEKSPPEKSTPGRPTGEFRKPVDGFPITSFFGNRVHPISGKVRFHKGIDIGTPVGTPIRASRRGKVVFAGWSGGYGQKIVIHHDDGYETLYAHLDKLLVNAGDRVTDKDIIGLSGSTGYVTGPHLHFEIRFHTISRNPLNYF